MKAMSFMKSPSSMPEMRKLFPLGTTKTNSELVLDSITAVKEVIGWRMANLWRRVKHRYCGVSERMLLSTWF